MIKLSELEAARKAMTFETMTNDCGVLLDEYDSEIGRLETSINCDGIVATHNAADALIAVTRAALDLKRANAEHIEAIRKLTFQNGSDSALFTLKAARSAAIKALDNLDAMLAQVTQ